MSFRNLILLSTLMVAGQAIAAAPISPTAAVAKQLKQGLSKQGLRRLGGGWLRSATRDKEGVTTLHGLGRQYQEWNGYDAKQNVQSVAMRDGEGDVSAVVQKTAGGKLLRMVTVERSGDQHKVEILTKKGLFTIGQTISAKKTAYGASAYAGPRSLRLGRLRIPIGLPNQKAVDRAMPLLLGGKLTAQALDYKLGAPHEAKLDTKDIALGRERTEGRATLDSFGAAVGASMYRTWGARGITNAGGNSPEKFAERFFSAMEQTRKVGGRIKFDLTGVDTKARFPSGSKPTLGNMTAWELSEIRNDARYSAMTDFYVQDRHGGFRKLSEREAERLVYAR